MSKEPQLDLELNPEISTSETSTSQASADVETGEPKVESITPPVALVESHVELLEQLAYSAQFNGGIQVVEGPPGSGKSTLAATLSRTYLDRCERLAEMGLVATATAQTVLVEAARVLGLRVQTDVAPGELIVSLRHFVQSLRAESSIAILIIDDAQYLDDQTLAAFASLLQGGEDSFGLHLVLFSEPGLAERLDALELVDIPVHDFAVPALSLAEAEALLQDYFNDAGRRPALVSGSSQAEQIWRDAGGRVGAILGAAEALEPGQPDPAPLSSLKGLPLAHMAALVVLVGILVWGFLARDPDSAETGEPSAVERATHELAVPAPDAEMQSTPLAEGVTPDDSTSTPVSQLEQGLSLEPVVDSEELRQALYGAGSSPASDIPVNEDPDNGAGENLPADSPSSGSDSASGAASAPEAPPKPAAASEGQDPDLQKLLSYSPESYSLQVMAASARESLERFRQEQPNRDQLLLYQTERQGHPWFVLLAGNYSSRESAVAAIAELPSAQQKAGPWPRHLESVHREIDADR